MSSRLFPPADSKKAAVVMAGSGEVVTYGELHSAAWRLARWFRSAGLRPGDHIALCLENQAAFMEVVWGAHAAGLAYTPISTRSAAPDAAYVINDSGAKVVVSSTAMASLATRLVDRCPRVERWLTLDGPVSGYEDLAAATSAMPTSPIPRAVAGRDMLYSSGTTGRP